MKRPIRTVILNGSPRPDGLISRMMEHAAKTIGGEVSLFSPSRMHIQPCTGCMACRREGVCRLPEDDAHRVADLLRQADLIVVGTPVYWANMSGPLKVLFDRLVPVFMGEGPHGLPQKKLRGRRGIVVTACTTPFPFDRLFGQSGGAGRAVGEILRAGGVKVRRVRVAGTRGRRHVPPPGLSGVCLVCSSASGTNGRAAADKAWKKAPAEKKKCRKRLSGIKNLLKNIQHQSSMITWTKMRRSPGNANPLCWLIFFAAIPTTREYRDETLG